MNEFVEQLKAHVDGGSFIKLTLSKPINKQAELVNVYIRPIVLRNVPNFSFTYRYKTNDQVKNYPLEEGYSHLDALLKNSFKNATLFTSDADVHLQTSKKGKISIRSAAPTATKDINTSHDRPKKKLANTTSPYLHLLGITDKTGKVIPKMADKYRQINKYLEIIEGLIASASLPKKVHVVDMGSGKGYLTFALYDFLCGQLKLDAQITGIELRKDLVDYCNSTAKKCGFQNLSFKCMPIQEFSENKIDILIALHACDTATDDAIARGISSNAQMIICAPCCHKQIRQQVKGKEQQSPLLKYGIFKERQFEMVTDTIRALIMEDHQYQSKIFEFVSNEHTRKNVMLVGVKNKKKENSSVYEKIDQIKKQFLVEEHYLETLVRKDRPTLFS